MIDAHYHRNGYPAFLRTPDGETPFYGIHPWQADDSFDLDAIRAQLIANPSSGVGEIGLDRLKTKTVSDAQRTIFAQQLELAAVRGESDLSALAARLADNASAFLQSLLMP